MCIYSSIYYTICIILYTIISINRSVWKTLTVCPGTELKLRSNSVCSRNQSGHG
ncbi:hypothetical protein FQN60_015445 [Etheostoma spectabile]|uniref:Uncharacterized protein n=1 Tax=Etheostoma spectabile TaxID=54343 RepID=A0A5J5CPT3_9PERO|nr:hypothetical protein FQN60_015445 [Etheostoma spectabile]